MPGAGGPGRGMPGQSAEDIEKERKRRQEEQKRKQEAGPQRTGRKKKKQGLDASNKLPQSKLPILNPLLSHSQHKVSPPPVKTGESQGLHLAGAGVHLEPRTPEAPGQE